MSLRLVIFDCDGVLVDSEPVANRVTAELMSAFGWEMDAAESRRRFLGMSLPDMRAVIEARIGPLPESFEVDLSARLVDALAREAEPMAGAAGVLRQVRAMGLQYRVASNSSRGEMAAKFACTGLAPLVEARFHSFEEVARGKPAPDLFLAAAAAEGVPPEHAIVVEDSVPGVRGALAAGMPCIGFAAHGEDAALLDAGAYRLVRALDELPRLLRARIAGDQA